MIDTKESARLVETAVLVGVYTERAGKTEAESLLDELGELVDTLGIRVIERHLVFHREMHARYLIGSGKAEEIVARAKEQGLDAIIFDNQLTPTQQRQSVDLAGGP